MALPTESGSQFVGGLISLMNSIGQEAPALMWAIGVLSFVAGIWLNLLGVLYLVRKGNRNSTQAYGIQPNAWLWNMLVGTLLIALPETMSSITQSFITDGFDSSPFVYAQLLKGEGLGLGSCKLNGIRPLLVVLGTAFVINGLWQLRTLRTYGRQATNGAGPGQAVMKCVGGMGVVHMQAILEFLHKTTGLTLGAALC